jgi:hypothetical protein
VLDEANAIRARRLSRESVGDVIRTYEVSAAPRFSITRCRGRVELPHREHADHSATDPRPEGLPDALPAIFIAA